MIHSLSKSEYEESRPSMSAALGSFVTGATWCLYLSQYSREKKALDANDDDFWLNRMKIPLLCTFTLIYRLENRKNRGYKTGPAIVGGLVGLFTSLVWMNAAVPGLLRALTGTDERHHIWIVIVASILPALYYAFILYLKISSFR